MTEDDGKNDLQILSTADKHLGAYYRKFLILGLNLRYDVLN